ncbi:MAG: alpha-glucan family phosphorylase [Mahellales bacterium]
MEKDKLPRVAYFCMEFGLSPDFKIYSGGLGILAGDYLKAAKDLEKPVIGIGLLWKQDYTQQYINDQGYPYDTFPTFQYDFLEDTGTRVGVNIYGRDIVCKVLKTEQFDNAPLYLLDADIDDNEGWQITDQLYGGFSEKRIPQEMVLGIGGIRAIRALDIDVDIYHFNEGHAIFAGIELIREKMEQENMSFDQAWTAVRKNIVFTTHTPVKEGNEFHDHPLLERAGAYNGLPFEKMAALGDVPFNMTVAGLRLSKIANAVSELHGETTRNMWKDTWCGAPVISVTNGVHNGTWANEKIIEAFNNNGDILSVHNELKKQLIDYVAQKTNIVLKENILLVGFARRATSYKRANLIFRDENRILPLLEEGKIQFIFSGKAHPQDHHGKNIVSRLVYMARKFPNQIVFLENYDMAISKMMTSGCDIWLNCPRRPNEASGTSGMKAAMNGVLNFSTLDGWWAEACQHFVNGWQFGDGYSSYNVEDQDRHDADGMYRVLMEEIIPTYYGNKEKWQEMMRASIDTTYYQFSASRMLEDYYNKMYLAQTDATSCEMDNN